MTVLNMNCVEGMRLFPDGYFDSVVTDPPYELGFMGKTWDASGIAYSVEMWREALRVLKPGGHLLAFSGSRTYHRMVCAIEDAGFEIRDQIMWVYGSGFPKSLDVSKAIDKARTEDLAPLRVICRAVRAAMDARGQSSRDLVAHFGDCNPRLIDHWAARDTDSQPSLPTPAQWSTLRSLFPELTAHDAEVDRLNGRKGTAGEAWQTAAVLGEHERETPGFVGMRFDAVDRSIREPSDAARQWQGWGTALKPAFEPVVVARKANTAETERDTIDANLLTLEARLWSMLFALRADAPSPSSQNESNVALSIARWTAGDVTNTLAALSDRMDMLRCESAINTCLSIVSSWRHTWADLSKPGSTSITTTESSMTTDSKTLSFCTSQITPLCIIPAVTQADGWPARAGNAARFFHAELSRLTATRERSVLAHAIEQDRLRSLDADDKVKHEPIVVARKPLIGTVAANVLAHGTGAINVDGCRVGDEPITQHGRNASENRAMAGANYAEAAGRAWTGRWPANLIHDGSDEVLAAFPQDAGRFYYAAKASKRDRNEGLDDFTARAEPAHRRSNIEETGDNPYLRGVTERLNTHPTVKPTDLMRYLCRLVTPPGGTVLDPFTGSGSTGKAARLEGFGFIGFELSEEYTRIATARIAGVSAP